VIIKAFLLMRGSSFSINIAPSLFHNLLLLLPKNLQAAQCAYKKIKGAVQFSFPAFQNEPLNGTEDHGSFSFYFSVFCEILWPVFLIFLFTF
jgi:hypothetical protein